MEEVFGNCILFTLALITLGIGMQLLLNTKKHVVWGSMLSLLLSPVIVILAILILLVVSWIQYHHGIGSPFSSWEEYLLYKFGLGFLFTLALIALGVGIQLLLNTRKHAAWGSILSLWLSPVIVLLAILTLLGFFFFRYVYDDESYYLKFGDDNRSIEVKK